MSVRFYRVSQRLLRSAVPMPELLEAPAGPPDLVFETETPGPLAPGPWTTVWTQPDGRPWLATARQEDEYLLQVADLADFRVGPARGVVRARPHPDTPLDTVRHLFLDQVLPLLLAHRGALVVHASAVVLPAGAVAFAGPSGSGKSTLAARLVAEGAALVADDTLVLEPAGRAMRAVPAYPGVRLWPDAVADVGGHAADAGVVAHYTTKRRIDARVAGWAFAREPVRLARLYLLERDDRATKACVTPVSGRDGLVALINYAYRLDLGDRERLQREFEERATQVRGLGMRRLVLPPGFEHLGAVRRAVLEDLDVTGEEASDE